MEILEIAIIECADAAHGLGGQIISDGGCSTPGDVAKAFGDKLLYDNLNFTLPQAGIVGIIGPNGAGKSTIIRLISGAERPTSGRITRGMSVSWPLAFGGAFQGTLTGLDNLRFICRVYGTSTEDKVPFVQEFSELGRYLHEPVKTYSAGMRARLAFAISMVIEFDCFLIDEIVAVGDRTIAPAALASQ